MSSAGVRVVDVEIFKSVLVQAVIIAVTGGQR